MSKIEIFLQEILKENNIEFIIEYPIPINNFPWKTKFTKSNPKCDIFIPSINLFIEIKGFMTIEAISKMGFLSKQNNINYYIFQAAEFEWYPYNSPLIKNINFLKYLKEKDIEYFNFKNFSKSKRLKNNINFQITELLFLNKEDNRHFSLFTLNRLKYFLKLKLEQYNNWVGGINFKIF